MPQKKNKEEVVRYTFGGINFRTWADVKEHGKKIIRKGARELIGEEYEFTREFFEYHAKAEERLARGISKIVVRNAHAGSGLCFAIVDNSEELRDFSIKDCKATKKKNPEKVRQRYDIERRLNAYRSAIRCQTDNFYKRQKVYQCNECVSNGLISLSGKLCVDHTPPFVKLVSDFEEQYEFDKYPEIDRHEGAHEDLDFFVPSTEENKKFIEAWQKYHQQNVTFQLLCNSCNARKNSSGYRYIAKAA